MSAFVQLGDALGLELLVAAVAVQHGELARHLAAGLADVDRGAGQLAAVDGDHLHAAHRLLGLLVAQHQQRERHDVGGLGTEVLDDHVGRLAGHRAVGLADAAAWHDDDLAEVWLQLIARS